jgi:hypothetical protein
MQNKTLIVLGMHRSGTSLITQWLHHCGLEVGESLLGPGLGNDEGHFEDTEFYKMHLEILRDNNLHDSGIINQPVTHISSYHKEKVKGIIAVKNQLFAQWGWKDPRTCLFLDFYRELLPDAFYLVAIRDYQSVVVSLLRRTFAERDIIYNTQKGYLAKLAWQKLRRKQQFKKFCRQNAAAFLKIWIVYNEYILDDLMKLSSDRYLVVNFHMLNEKDTDVITHLNQNWGFSLTHTRFSAIYNEKLFSKPLDVESYITDEQLIGAAKILTNKLKNYAIN